MITMCGGLEDLNDAVARSVRGELVKAVLSIENGAA